MRAKLRFLDGRLPASVSRILHHSPNRLEGAPEKIDFQLLGAQSFTAASAICYQLVLKNLPALLHQQLPYALAICAAISALAWKFLASERRRAIATVPLLFGAACCWIFAEATRIFWLWEAALLLAEIAVVQVAAILIFRVALWRLRLPLIVRELFLGICYAVILLATLSRFGANVLSIVATSTVITAIIGLSMQDTLLNVIGGMVLHMEHVIRLNDYIKTQEHGEGWVRSVRTRFTSIETYDGDLMVIPNSNLMKNAVTVMGNVHREVVKFSLSYDTPPQNICSLVQKALRDSPIRGVSLTPAPECAVLQLYPTHIEYGAVVWLSEKGSSVDQISAVLTRVYYALARARLTPAAVPQRVDLLQPGERTLAEADDRKMRLDALKNNEIFGALAAEELEFLAERFVRMAFATGEAVVRQGDEGDCLYLVTHGHVHVMLKGPDNRSAQIAVLGTGSIFGEMSLLSGERRSASVVADGHVECDRLHKADFAGILQRRPELAEQISLVLSARQSSLSEARNRLNATAQETRQDFLSRIQSFFGIGNKTMQAPK